MSYLTSEFYVYLLIDPSNLKPFYVGKGKNLRWKAHFKSNAQNKIKKGKIKNILDKGQEVLIEFYVLDVTEETAFLVEKALIAKYGRIDIQTGILANMTDGGEGCIGRSKESRAKTSMKLKGKQKSDTHKANLSISLQGNEPWNKGKIGSMKGTKYRNQRTKENRDNMSASLVSRNNRENVNTLRLLKEKLQIKLGSGWVFKSDEWINEQIEKYSK